MARPRFKVSLRLEWWNGVEWETNKALASMTATGWRNVRGQIKHWSSPWRVLKTVLVESSPRKRGK